MENGASEQMIQERPRSTIAVVQLMPSERHMDL